MTTTISLQEMIRHSFREVPSYRWDAFQVLWLPALGLSIFEVLFGRLWGEGLSLWFMQSVGGVPQSLNGMGVATIQLFSYMILLTIVNMLAQSFVGAFWLLWLQDKKNGLKYAQTSPRYLRHPTYRNFLSAWILLSLMGMGVIIGIVVIVGLFLGGLSSRTGSVNLPLMMLCILLGIPFSSYLLGRCSMVLPASLATVQEKRFHKSWRETATQGRELAWLLFIFTYAMPLMLLLPGQMFQLVVEIFFGMNDSMSQAVLIAFVRNVFVLSAVLFLVSGLSYVYDKNKATT